mmetsp:Transcript_27459/g.26542  ORF Transcript_27459/g.26542 Transcript_27459/m.26542 type:complete len:91 (-) Transcript_27459:26-298(-)
MKICYDFSAEEYDLMRCFFCAKIDNENEQGWEELVNASMTHLLKTCLSKGGASAAQNINSQIKTLADVSKLKQNITSVNDRIKKGGKLEL